MSDGKEAKAMTRKKGKISDKMRMNWLQKQRRFRIASEGVDLFVRFSPDVVDSRNLRKAIDAAMRPR